MQSVTSLHDPVAATPAPASSAHLGITIGRALVAIALVAIGHGPGIVGFGFAANCFHLPFILPNKDLAVVNKFSGEVATH